MTKRKYYIDKRCTKMGGSKFAKKPNEKKRFSLIYSMTKVQKLCSPNSKKAKKTLLAI